MPLVLGGDHSVAIGTVAGIARSFHQRNEKIGLIWIDAHADMNTPETSPSGNVHGMPLACCIGRGPTELTHLFDFAPKVEPAMSRSLAFAMSTVQKCRTCGRRGTAYTMRDIDERGLRNRHARSDRTRE